MLVSGLHERISSPTGAWSTQAGQDGDAFESSLSSLFASITSGNMDDAQKYLAQVRQSSTGQVAANSALHSFLESVGDSLANGDIGEAQTALATLKNYSASGSTAGAASNASSAFGQASSETSSLGENVLSLSSALGSGNLDGAIDSYNNLAELFTDGSGLKSSNDLIGNLAEDSDATGQFQMIGSSLNAGDINSAQMALDGFLTSLSAGSLIQAKA